MFHLHSLAAAAGRPCTVKVLVFEFEINLIYKRFNLIFNTILKEFEGRMLGKRFHLIHFSQNYTLFASNEVFTILKENIFQSLIMKI